MGRVTVAASAGLLVAMALALVGCSDTSLLASAATGPVVAGSTYSFHAPQGWSEPDATTRVAGVDAEIVNGSGAGTGFVDTMVVVPEPTGVLTPDQVESDGVSNLTAAGITDVQVLPRVVVGGAESSHLTGTRPTNAGTYVIDQYYLTHDGQTWIVNFSFDQDASQEARDDLAGSVLVTWKWS